MYVTIEDVGLVINVDKEQQQVIDLLVDHIYLQVQLEKIIMKGF
jgi:hypothetical protein